jgi:hypothetical protein
VEETKAIVGDRLPLTFDPNGGSETFIWPAAAAALLARGVVIMETTAALAEQNRMADAQISLRVMLEHAVVFCWIAIDPPTNLTEWRRWDDWRRLKVHRDAAKYGVEVLSPERVEEIGDPPSPRSVPDLAVLVDRYWSERSGGFRDNDIRTFRGLYAAVYRRSSTLVHPTQEGMERHMLLTAEGLVISMDEQPAKPSAPFFLALPMMALMLLVYQQHFGWPDEDTVRALENGLNSSG